MVSLALALAVLAGGPLRTFAYDKLNTGAAPSDDWELVYEHKIPKMAGKNNAGGTGWTERSDIPYKQSYCNTMGAMTKVAYVNSTVLFSAPQFLPRARSNFCARRSFELFAPPSRGAHNKKIPIPRTKYRIHTPC